MTEKIDTKMLKDIDPLTGDSVPVAAASISEILQSLATAIDAVSTQNLSAGTIGPDSLVIQLSDGGDVTIDAATASAAGVMSAADKTLLEGTAANLVAAIAAGVAVNNAVGRLQTLSGVAAEANNLGSFDGDTIGDNESVKGALQAIETALEGAPAAGTDLSKGTHTATSLQVDSSTGTSVTLGQATEVLAGLLAAVDKAKLAQIAVTQPVDLDELEAQVAALSTTSAPVEPEVPTYDIPSEIDCDIVVDAQNFEIFFQRGTPGTDVLAANSWSGLGLDGYSTGDLTTMAAADGNPVGSNQGELNLIAQALNMAVEAKGYGGDGYGAPLGRIIVGVKGGNGGTVRLSYTNSNSSPASRVTANSISVWDNARDSAPYEDPLAGYDYAHHGMDVVFVALDEDAQMRMPLCGPESGDIYDSVSNPTGTKGANENISIFNMKLRAGSGSNSTCYFSMKGPMEGDFIADSCEFMPLDEDADAETYRITNDGGNETGYDAKWGFLFDYDVRGNTILVRNGTSGDFPSGAMQSVQPAADPIVVFQEHVYYLKGGGSVYILDHGQPLGGGWPFKTLTAPETNRTFFQIRPDINEETDGRDGTILIKDNTVPDHGNSIIGSSGAHPLDGGGVMTVWANVNGDTWFSGNVVTDAYYNPLVVANQVSSKMLLNAFGYPIARVFISNNELSGNAASVGTSRNSAIIYGAQEVHFMAGNDISPGVALTKGVQLGYDGTDAIDVGSYIQQAGVDPASDFDSMVYWDGASFITVDLADIPSDVPTWSEAVAFADYGPAPSHSALVSAAYLAEPGEMVLCDPAGTGGFTVSLPAAPVAGDWVRVIDATSSAAGNAIVVSPNGNKFHSFTVNDTLGTVAARARYEYSGIASVGWVRTA